MFTTMQKCPLYVGSYSTGTLCTEDLLPEAVYMAEKIAKAIAEDGTTLHRLIGEANALLAMIADDGEWTGDQLAKADEILWEIADEIGAYLPSYVYVGMHPGDGADFGVWIDVESACEQEFKIEAGDDEPSSDEDGDPIASWVSVTDRGNVSLYARGADGKTVEVWSVV